MKMVMYCLLSAVISAAVFLLTFKLALPVRMGLGVGVFVVIVICMVLVIGRIGDPAPPDSIVIYPATSQ